MAQATETLRKNRTVQFNFTLDAKALMTALGRNETEEDDDGMPEEEGEEGSAVGVLRKKRAEETPIVKLSQTPMAG